MKHQQEIRGVAQRRVARHRVEPHPDAVPRRHETCHFRGQVDGPLALGLLRPVARRGRATAIAGTTDCSTSTGASWTGDRPRNSVTRSAGSVRRSPSSRVKASSSAVVGSGPLDEQVGHFLVGRPLGQGADVVPTVDQAPRLAVHVAHPRVGHGHATEAYVLRRPRHHSRLLPPFTTSTSGARRRGLPHVMYPVSAQVSPSQPSSSARTASAAHRPL